MLLARRVDDRMFALNRQGRAPFVVGSSGHEAIQVASAMALDREKDWVLPYYRDMGVALAWGLSLLDIFRRRLCARRRFLLRWPPASQPLVECREAGLHPIVLHRHPVPPRGWDRQGAADRRDDAVVAVYGGEGSTSEGDWHEAVNFAGIHRLPDRFHHREQPLCHLGAERRRGGRINPRSRRGLRDQGTFDRRQRSAASSIRTVKEAAERARAGEGPSLIEAETYRYYAHTSDDDDRLYRSREEVEEWRRHDPVVTLKQYLIEERLAYADRGRGSRGGSGCRRLPQPSKKPRRAPAPTIPTAMSTPG